MENIESNLNKFKLPILFTPNIKILNTNILVDLELNKIIKNSDLKESDLKESNLKESDLKESVIEDKPIYDYIFNPTNSLGKKMLEELPLYYTTDVQFLKESQLLLDNISNKELKKIHIKLI